MYGKQHTYLLFAALLASLSVVVEIERGRLPVVEMIRIVVALFLNRILPELS